MFAPLLIPRLRSLASSDCTGLAEKIDYATVVRTVAKNTKIDTNVLRQQAKPISYDGQSGLALASNCTFQSKKTRAKPRH